MFVPTDTTRFDEMIDGLTARLTNPAVEFGDLFRGQIGQILDRCIEGTPKKERERLRAEAESTSKGNRYDNGTETVSLGVMVGRKSTQMNNWMLDPSTWEDSHWQRLSKKTGSTNASGSRTPPATTDGGRAFHIMNGNRKWSNKRWNRYLLIKSLIEETRDGIVKEATKRALESSGLTAASWWQIADNLGVSEHIRQPKYIHSAKTFKGAEQPNMATSISSENSDSLFIEIVNYSLILTGRNIDGHSILQNAINTRADAFIRDLEFEGQGKIVNWAGRYRGFTANA